MLEPVFLSRHLPEILFKTAPTESLFLTRQKAHSPAPSHIVPTPAVGPDQQSQTDISVVLLETPKHSQLPASLSLPDSFSATVPISRGLTHHTGKALSRSENTPRQQRTIIHPLTVSTTAPKQVGAISTSRTRPAISSLSQPRASSLTAPKQPTSQQPTKANPLNAPPRNSSDTPPQHKNSSPPRYLKVNQLSHSRTTRAFSQTTNPQSEEPTLGTLAARQSSQITASTKKPTQRLVVTTTPHQRRGKSKTVLTQRTFRSSILSPRRTLAFKSQTSLPGSKTLSNWPKLQEGTAPATKISGQSLELTAPSIAVSVSSKVPALLQQSLSTIQEKPLRSLQPLQEDVSQPQIPPQPPPRLPPQLPPQLSPQLAPQLPPQLPSLLPSQLQPDKNASFPPQVRHLEASSQPRLPPTNPTEIQPAQKNWSQFLFSPKTESPRIQLKEETVRPQIPKFQSQTPRALEAFVEHIVSNVNQAGSELSQAIASALPVPYNPESQPIVDELVHELFVKSKQIQGTLDYDVHAVLDRLQDCPYEYEAFTAPVQFRWRRLHSEDSDLPDTGDVDLANLEAALQRQKFQRLIGLLPKHETFQLRSSLIQTAHSPKVQCFKLPQKLHNAHLQARPLFTATNLPLRYYQNKRQVYHSRTRSEPLVRPRKEARYEERIYGRLKGDPPEVLLC